MNKHSFKIAVIFSLLVFIILTITMVLTGFIAMVAYQVGIIRTQSPAFIFGIFALVSILIGTFFSKVAGKRPLKTIIEISEVTKEVAKGNFDVRLNEDIRAAELHTMAHNFNVMIKELDSTELFRKDFIENVSHEFKTPLSAIEGYVTLLQNKSLSKEKREEYTQKILFNTKRLSSLTGNILLLSRLENQEIDTHKESYFLDEQLREILILFESQWDVKKLDLDIDLDEASYYGNKELLAQVWQNIIGNAVKFTPENGTICVLLRKAESKITVSISDTGPGMSQDVMDRVYEKFYQADPSRAACGSGLGLALAKRIVSLHDGTISVSSKEGKGTTFTVMLPSPNS